MNNSSLPNSQRNLLRKRFLLSRCSLYSYLLLSIFTTILILMAQSNHQTHLYLESIVHLLMIVHAQHCSFDYAINISNQEYSRENGRVCPLLYISDPTLPYALFKFDFLCQIKSSLVHLLRQIISLLSMHPNQTIDQFQISHHNIFSICLSHFFLYLMLQLLFSHEIIVHLNLQNLYLSTQQL